MGQPFLHLGHYRSNLPRWKGQQRRPGSSGVLKLIRSHRALGLSSQVPGPIQVRIDYSQRGAWQNSLDQGGTQPADANNGHLHQETPLSLG
jgi:hypothetical protein